MLNNTTTPKLRAARGFVWGLVNQGTMQVLNLAFGIVLARQLSQDDYGIVGVLAVFSIVATNLQQCGFIQGLVNMRSPQHEDYNSVFWFNISLSATIYAILFFAAPLIAHFFHEPRLVHVSRILFIGFVLSALGTAPGAYIAKHIMVKESTIISVVALICSGAAGIVLAYNGFSYWSLAWQQVIYVGVSTIGRYIVAPFRPTLHFTFRPVRRMFRFSVWLMLTTLMSTLSNQLLTFIFGRLMPITDVGYFAQANKWNITATETVRGAVVGIAQPVLAELRDDGERALRALRTMMRYTALISFPALLGVALVSHEFITVSIGDKWAGSATLLSALAIGGTVAPLYVLLSNVLVAAGRSVRFLVVSAVQLIGQLAIALIVIKCSQPEHRMLYVVMSFSLYNLIYLFVWHASVRSLSRYSLVAMLTDIMPYALSATATVVIVHFATIAMGIDTPLMLLIARIAITIVLYIAVLALIRPADLKEAFRFFSVKC